jgi:hypothetical protein
MDLFKKVILALFVSISMFAISPAVMAGVPEPASREEVIESIENTIKLSEQTLAAIIANESKKSVEVLFKATRKESKKIESTPVERTRSKASQKMGKARLAYKKGHSEKAEELMIRVVELFKKVQEIHNRLDY